MLDIEFSVVNNFFQSKFLASSDNILWWIENKNKDNYNIQIIDKSELKDIQKVLKNVAKQLE